MKKYLKLSLVFSALLFSSCGDKQETTYTRQLNENCNEFDQCLEGLTCENGKCRAICKKDNDCNADQECKNNRCVNKVGQNQDNDEPKPQSCGAGFTGPDCGTCLPGYFGTSCTPCPGLSSSGSPCSGHGVCSDGPWGEGTCECLSGFSGADCSGCAAGFDPAKECKECLPGYYGHSCRDVCPGGIENICSGNGTCDDGANGTGVCDCNDAISGDDCSGCPGHKTNPPNCDKCVENYFGINCENECPKTENGYCDGHGTCNASGLCECDTGWSGTKCNDCANGYYGASCKPCECNGHGTCNQGIHGEGCICDSSLHFTGEKCNQCQNGWQGKNCDTCEYGDGTNCNSCIKDNGYDAGICKFKDNRNGTVYPVYKIGGKFWFGQNVDYKTSDCFAPNNDSNNIKSYGCLYKWAAAKTICPAPWRLPTVDDFTALHKAVGGANSTGAQNLRATNWNNGTDAYGFRVLPAGNVYAGEYKVFGEAAYFWSMSGYDDDEAYYINVKANSTALTHNHINNGNSVRCIKD